MNKTFRQCTIDYIKNRRLCKGYVDYIVSSLNKLEQIEQIINESNIYYPLETVEQIREVING